MKSRIKIILKYSTLGSMAGATFGAGLGAAIGGFIYINWITTSLDCEVFTAVGCQNPCQTDWHCYGYQVAQMDDVSAGLKSQKLISLVGKQGIPIGAAAGSFIGGISGALYGLFKKIPAAPVPVPASRTVSPNNSEEHTPSPVQLSSIHVSRGSEEEQVELDSTEFAWMLEAPRPTIADLDSPEAWLQMTSLESINPLPTVTPISSSYSQHCRLFRSASENNLSEHKTNIQAEHRPRSFSVSSVY